jgi:hypothetical protein
MIENDDCSYTEFFGILKDALDNGKDVKKTDEPVILRCGFTIDGSQTYLMKMKELKYAQKDVNINTSLYMNLQK